MSLADIDAAATARRIREIADNAQKAFEAHAQRSAEIDAASREAVAKEEADRKAVEERRAELEARKAAAAQQPEKLKPSPRPRSATLSLGAEEFKLDRQARQAAEQDKPAEPVQVEPEATEPARPNRTLRLGGRDQGVAEQDEPSQKRPPRPEGDDDMSGRTWLR